MTHEGWKLVDVCKGGDERYRNIIERELIEVKFECMGREDSFTTSLWIWRQLQVLFSQELFLRVNLRKRMIDMILLQKCLNKVLNWRRLTSGIVWEGTEWSKRVPVWEETFRAMGGYEEFGEIRVKISHSLLAMNEGFLSFWNVTQTNYPKMS